MQAANIAEGLNTLIKLKSKRDNAKFTAYKLSKEIDVDRSLIQRILKGEVESPRLDTLMKITKFFVDDGFALTIDELVGWKSNLTDLFDHNLTVEKAEQATTLPLYQMSNFDGTKIGATTISLPKISPGTIAIVSTEYISPYFDAGSIFITDMLKTPEHNHLIMVKELNSNHLMLKKYIVNNDGTKKLRTYDVNDNSIQIAFNEEKTKIIGVVIKIISKL